MRIYTGIATTSILLAICGCQKEGAVKPAATTSASAEALFKKVESSHSGITFANRVDENINNYFDYFAYVYNGGGVGLADINNDGLTDVYFTGNEVPNKLYLNQGGMKFKDITESAGVAGNGRWNNGVTMVDVNGDGFVDIYVSKGGWHDKETDRRNLLFINQGNLTFKEQAKDFGLDEAGYSIHASFFDMDNDNDLDAYVTNRPDSFDLPLTEMIRQKRLSPTSSRDKLYRNDNGKFKEIGLQAGINSNFGYALSVVTSDLNNDGYTDIFVANDFAEGDYMYINQGNGTFKEEIKKATNHISMYSMGTDIADINNDGLEDIMVSEMLPEDYKRSRISMPSMDVAGFNAIVDAGMHKQYMHNALHLNQGNLFFSEISQLSGVAKTEWSWSCLLSDFDNDGNRDLFVANGYRRDVFDGDVASKLTEFAKANRGKYNSPMEMLENDFKGFIENYEPIKVKNYLFRNRGDLTFQNTGTLWGFNEVSFSNGAAVGDLDNDGDLDMVINNLDDEAFVYENTSAGKTNYLKVKLEGPAGNRDGIDAKVTIYYNNKLQHFQNKTVRGFLSSNEPIVHFGLADVTAVDSIVVHWPDGKENTLAQTKANQTLKVSYIAARPAQLKKQPSLLPFTESTTQALSAPFVHKENKVDEYADQVLLPHMFSRNGPFISVGDVDRDGSDDFYIGGASGQSGALYLQRNSQYVKKSTSSFEADKGFEDMGSVMQDFDGDGDFDLYVSSGGAEFDEGSPRYKDRLYLNDGKGNFGKAQMIDTKSSGSCVVPIDFDKDGDMDLFRGGQVVAHKYPSPPSSYLLVNDKGRLIDRTAEIAPELAKVGMVSSATTADLDGDGSPELIVVGEWMPVTVFSHVNGRMKDVSKDFISEETSGWWSTITADDIDGDGDQDLIAGNIGENYKFKASVEKPFQVYADDFDHNGTNDIFLARYLTDSMLVPIRGRECTSQQMPVIAEKFPTFRDFANSDLPGIIGDGIKQAVNKKATLFSSVLMINEGGKLRSRKLPVDVQVSVVNSIIVDDFDGDGIKDILLAGNKFDTEVETTPADGSPGFYMKGLGDLKFRVLKSTESGFFVPYNVKDAHQLKSVNGNTIVVASNNDKLRMFAVRKDGHRTVAVK
ncbi:VCBS repeat-containing protein [Chryseolinea sp. T2]|uniref:VCBS repeat-containing protein n=1 Tax=Chryseolinea sp. T2 TaxID=3129255 RepID=UPI003076CC7B